MKGFIFTVDAIFSLIVASAAVAILLYTYYLAPASYSPPVDEAYSILQSLESTTMLQASQGSSFAAYAVDGYISNQYTWSSYGQNGAMNSSTQGFAPPGPFLLFNFTAPCVINPNIAVADGLIAFTTYATSAIPCSASRLYVLNASTGSVIVNTTNGGTFTTGTTIYDHLIFAGNSIDYLNAFNESGGIVWDDFLPDVMNGANVTGIEDGYLQALGELFSPTNGTFVASTGLYMPIAYGNGEFIASQSGNGGNNAKLLSYSLTTNSFVHTWGFTLGSATISMLPAIGTNYTAAGTGTTLIVTSLGGNFLWKRTLDSQVQGGVSALGTSIFTETQNGVYGFVAPLPAPEIMFGPTIKNTANITPSAAHNILYVEPNDLELQGYNPQTGALLWNLSLPSGVGISRAYGDIALAYGNTYATSGEALYAFGMCKADPRASVLQTVAQMYIDGEGACANMILNQTYPSQNFGIFIDGQYAPSMDAAYFPGLSGTFVQVQKSNSLDLDSNFSIGAWIYTFSKGTGDQQVVYKNGGFDFFITGNNKLQFSDTAGHYALSNTLVGTNSWTYVVGVYNGTPTDNVLSTNTIHLYVNGALQPMGAVGGWTKSGGHGNPVYIGENPAAAGNEPFNGLMADVQIYNGSLSAGQVQQLYSEGPGGSPTMPAHLVGWWPLEGDSNDYSGQYNTGFSSNIIFLPGGFTPPSLQNAFLVSRAAVPMYLTVGGRPQLYNVSVVNWR